MNPERLKALRSLPPQKFALVHECILHIDALQRRLDDPMDSEVKALRARVRELEDSLYRLRASPENSPRMTRDRESAQAREERKALQDALAAGDKEAADLLTRKLVISMRERRQAAGS